MGAEGEFYLRKTLRKILTFQIAFSTFSGCEKQIEIAEGIEIVSVVGHVPGQGIVAVAAVLGHLIRRRVPDAGSLRCTGMSLHRVLSTSPPYSTRQCRQPDRFQQTLWQTLHRQLYQLWDQPSQDKPEGEEWIKYF